MKLRRKQVGWWMLVTCLVLAGFGGGMSFEHRLANTKMPVVEQIQNLTGQKTGQPQTINFGTFWEAWSVVDNFFYGTADKQNRLNGAIAGMLQSTGDRYAAYLPKDENQLFMDDLAGTFSGIGAEITSIDGYPTIVSPLAGSPAEKADVRPRDVITQIDGVDTAGENFAHAINRIRGQAGTTVTLTVVREGVADVIKIPIVRAQITVPNVDYAKKDGPAGAYGYIHISEFLADSPKLVADAVADLQKQGVKGYVIDLRNNPGGLLDAAVQITSLFIDPAVKLDYGQVIVSQKDKAGTVTTYKVTQAPVLPKLPLVVLVNEGSASASEIMAGALLDYGRAKLVGTKTFGKGSVQELKSLSDGSSVKITVAHWLTPAGHEIDKVGIMPTTEVKLDPTVKVTAGDTSSDIQLRKAVELLQ